jgi:NADH-ubiquinone oxidoreductase chain 1
MINILIDLLYVILVLVPILLAVAFMTIIERRILAAMQRRVGPNIVGIYGILQPFADALKLVLKETIIPAQSTKSLFYLAPVWTLICSLLGWCVFPFGSGLTIFDYSLGILLTLAISSLSIYGVLLAGWSANSKYAFLGSIRSTAAMISYELVLSSAVLLVIFLSGSFNYTSIIENQQSLWYIVPLFPIFLLFFIAILAETSRVPFDLQEAESELVSGFMTEHSSIIFVFFFLGEYCSIVLMSTLTAILFFGGFNVSEIIYNNSFINIASIILAIKTSLFCFLFVWFRATLPRVRWDQIVSFAWTGLLPFAVAFLILVPSLLFVLDWLPISYCF